MSAGEQRDGGQNRQPVRLALPRAVLRHRERAGIYCQPTVSVEFQKQSKRYVVRGGESGGATREIVTLYHWRGLTMREIGLRYGINEGRMSQIHKRAQGLMAVRLAWPPDRSRVAKPRPHSCRHRYRQKVLCLGTGRAG